MTVQLHDFLRKQQLTGYALFQVREGTFTSEDIEEAALELLREAALRDKEVLEDLRMSRHHDLSLLDVYEEVSKVWEERDAEERRNLMEMQATLSNREWVVTYNNAYTDATSSSATTGTWTVTLADNNATWSSG